ncbi:MAG: hypothetical protein A3C50_02425 [Candidatus Staskawiczbacteria bacterium RIFCSPHIGHO2_02_FULL_43_16]|uniref:Uncharacterized protein n=1 Tax=Candidatus Staskawiczbacteria bacterium RIFCSPHIGHO2_01_FULL_41_41 TaxID=1802203 RepID=A0A1G2HVK4_9BACT|nr:MAG: hypothetical protein A2822_01660 [Candidatus Staskawiczbacteria bacterium RIFCSPHIGHO2_01_FULL_41_41]OGZ68144.1 MAG: hypothetical protein A3C50_02425 [Candidatus Staskawiczbacteria bacterium RIFCSPHIGHO2_02_FULL_43_16]OGZ74934.1 MAG: hypothetical protein A3A12_03820 [Candidatus Staskawiczbacteria bacterium RIFCSPLOWO2_01_FULL_43_17b]
MQDYTDKVIVIVVHGENQPRHIIKAEASEAESKVLLEKHGWTYDAGTRRFWKKIDLARNEVWHAIISPVLPTEQFFHQ